MATATAPAPTAKSAQVRQTKMLIDGKWVDSTSGRTFETINPSSRTLGPPEPPWELASERGS